MGVVRFILKRAGNEYKTWGRCGVRKRHDLTCANVNLEQEQVTPYQLVVGAFNAQGERASYSNTGSALWLSAPGGEEGGGLVTTEQTGCDRGFHLNQKNSATAFDSGEEEWNLNCDYTDSFIGTSAATPVVSGVVALLLEANPQLTWREVKHILASTAVELQPDMNPVFNQNIVLEQGWVTNKADSKFLQAFGLNRQQQAGGYGFSNHFGFGGVQARAAIEMAQDWALNQRQLPSFIKRAIAKQTESTIIPSQTPQGVSVVQQVVDNVLIIESVKVTLSIKSQDIQALQGSKPIAIKDYLIRLTSPSGTKSILLNPYHGLEDGYDLINFSMMSHAFYGEPAAGDWTLEVVNLNIATNPALAELTDYQFTFYGHEKQGY
jgi:subtilisin-like proprotein convertase family protein